MNNLSAEQQKALSEQYFQILHDMLVKNQHLYGLTEGRPSGRINPPQGHIITTLKVAGRYGLYLASEVGNIFSRYFITCEDYYGNFTGAKLIKNSHQPWSLYLSRKDAAQTSIYQPLYVDEDVQYDFFKEICEKISAEYFHATIILSARHFPLSVRLHYFKQEGKLDDFLFLWKAKRPTFIQAFENSDLGECLNLLADLSLNDKEKIALLHDFVNTKKTELKRIEMQKIFSEFVSYHFGASVLQQFYSILTMYHEDSFPLYAPTFAVIHIQYSRKGLFRALSHTKIQNNYQIKPVLNRLIFCLNKKVYTNRLHITKSYFVDDESGGDFYTVFIHLNTHTPILDYQHLVLSILKNIFEHSEQPDYKEIDLIVHASINHYLLDKSVNDKFPLTPEGNWNDSQADESFEKL
jgi:hypothetical protein